MRVWFALLSSHSRCGTQQILSCHCSVMILMWCASAPALKMHMMPCYLCALGKLRVRTRRVHNANAMMGFPGRSGLPDYCYDHQYMLKHCITAMDTPANSYFQQMYSSPAGCAGLPVAHNDELDGSPWHKQQLAASGLQFVLRQTCAYLLALGNNDQHPDACWL